MSQSRNLGEPIWMADDSEESQEYSQPKELPAGEQGKRFTSKKIVTFVFHGCTISLSLLMAITAIIGLSMISNANEIFVGVYMLFFSTLLLAFEFNKLRPTESVDHMFKRNFGFMYSVSGHAFFLIFVAFLSFGLGSPQILSFCTGALLGLLGMAKFALFLRNPELLEE